jgi:hypothetical protein
VPLREGERIWCNTAKEENPVSTIQAMFYFLNWVMDGIHFKGVFVCFGSNEVWTQGLTLVYCLSHSTSPFFFFSLLVIKPRACAKCSNTEHYISCRFFWGFFPLRYWGLNSGPVPWAIPPALFLWLVFFKIGSHELFSQGWLWTADPPDLCFPSS